MTPIDKRALEAVARAIYSSRLLIQPREAWRSRRVLTVTEKFCIEAAEAAIIAYEAAKPKEGLKLGSRLTVEGVEAVVVPMATIEAHEKLIAELRGSIDALLDDRERRAMLSAAGDGR